MMPAKKWQRNNFPIWFYTKAVLSRRLMRKWTSYFVPIPQLMILQCKAFL